tara:strand:- start:779 stop:1378 length:600 start_codon:yes stop_codon:yes gene_type:complete
MAKNNVSDFLTKVKQGVRPNMFEVQLTFPTTIGLTSGDDDLLTLMCKSAALPASNIGVIEVPFRGRTVKIAGDRTFDNWSATFINDKEMQVRSRFEQWLAAVNEHKANKTSSADGVDPTKYTTAVQIKQLEKDNSEGGKTLRQYKLWYAFPTAVSAIDLAYDSNDQIEEFSVEFQYSYWTVGGDGDESDSTTKGGFAIP